MLTPHDFNLSHFLLHELPHEVFHVDGKLPRTLRLLFLRPGFLPGEYVAGRRTPYVNPLRFYLLVYLTFALITAIASHTLETLPDRAAQIDPSGWVGRLAAERTSVRWDDPVTQERIEARAHWLAEGGTMLIFLGVAVLQSLLFRASRRRYLEHAVLGLSVSTFFVLVSLGFAFLSMPARVNHALGNASPITQILSIGALVIYWYVAIRWFYGTSRLRAASATIVITLAQILIAVALNIGILALLVVTT